ncbi:MAG TPA: HDOD domain-containing protein [Phycisphaerae bacterium]|nr:HDOD domain-containing protein [Phycisphaerae bacterium]
MIEKIRKEPKIPAPSQSVMKVLELTKQKDCDVKKVASVISRDGGLTAQLLRQANSALYGYNSATSSVVTACTRLGMSRVRSAVVNQHVVNGLAGARPPGFDAFRYWQAALATSVAGHDLCQRFLPNDAEEAGTAGLLCDIGVGLLAFGVPETYARVISEVARPTAWNFAATEARLLGVTHTEVGAAVLTDWKLDQRIIDAVRSDHTDPLSPAKEKLTKFAQIVAAGVTLSRIALEGSDMDSVATLFAQMEPLTAKPEEVVSSLLDALVTHMQKTAKSLSVELGSLDQMQANFGNLGRSMPDVSKSMSFRPMARAAFQS